MQEMKGLEELRRELDEVDRELVRLFERRMAIAGQVAACKIAAGRPVLDRTREEAVLASRAAMLKNPAWEADVRKLFETLMALSRREQQRIMDGQEADGHA